MRKRILMIFILIISLMFTSKVAAEEVRYDVTSLNINDTKITFKGWAFIYKTHNFVSYDGGSAVESQYGSITNGEQRIKIRAIANGQQIDEKEVVGGGNYNFYCQMYFFLHKKEECKAAYTGTFPSDYSVASNKCGPQEWDQCLYEDIDFNIQFDTSKWDLSDGTTVTFEIAVHNKDFQNKYGKYWSSWNTLFLNEQIKPNNTSRNIIINKNKNNNKVKVIVAEGLFRDINGDYVVEDSSGNKCDYKAYGCSSLKVSSCPSCHWSDAVSGAVYTISSTSNSYSGCKICFKNGYVGSSPGNYLIGYTEPGQYLVYTKKTYVANGNRYPATDEEIANGEYKEMAVWASWVIPVGEFSIQVYNDKKCEPKEPSINASCNSTSPSFSTTCNELTVRAEDSNGETKAKAEVKIEQVGTITTFLTPDSTYAGGGFKFGVMYYNTISWFLIRQSIGTKDDIISVVKSKLKDSFVNEFGLKNVKFGNESIPDDYFRQNIQCKETGSFDEGDTLTTMCIVYLPNSVVEDYTGKVTYKTTDNNLGLNNKYYTPLTWDSKNKYEITATIYGMDRLKESSVMSDSKNKGTAWTGKWETTLNGASSNCAINLYSLYGQPTKGKDKFKYIFIYRPIDLNNPFPNRNPGMNWYDWYSDNKNKERLESSYDREQYSITLDSQKTSEIKKYNKNELNKGGYFDWKTIEDGESSFIDKFFDKKRDNIVGDNS